jgi:hypothetical protein
VHRDAGALARGVQARHDRLALADHDLAVDVGRYTPHAVVGGGLDGDRVGERLDPEVDPGELRDVGELLLYHLGVQVPDVEVNVVLAVHSLAFLDLLVDRAADHVPGREVLDRGRVTLHEPLALAVQQDAALSADGLGDQDPHLVDAGGVELEELHVL